MEERQLLGHHLDVAVRWPDDVVERRLRDFGQRLPQRVEEPPQGAATEEQRALRTLMQGMWESLRTWGTPERCSEAEEVSTSEGTAAGGGCVDGDGVEEGESEGEVGMMRESDWRSLSSDVLDAVMACLWVGDHRGVRLVCRGWREAVGPAVREVQVSDARHLPRVPTSFPRLHTLDLSRCPTPLSAHYHAPALLALPSLPHLRALALPPRSTLCPALLIFFARLLRDRPPHPPPPPHPHPHPHLPTTDQTAPEHSRLLLIDCVWQGDAGVAASLSSYIQEPWCDPLAGEGDAAGEEEGGGDSPPSPLEAASLTEIDLSGCESLSDSAVGSLAALFPHMTSLSLADCASVGPLALTSLGRHPRLRTLRLSACHRLDSTNDADLEDAPGEQALAALTIAARARTRPLPSLTSLDLADLRALCDPACALLPHLAALAHLRLDRCTALALSPAPLAALPRLAALARLSLVACAQLTDAALAALGRCARLEALSLRACVALTHLGDLATCGALTDLDASGCSGLTGGGGLPEIVVLPLRTLRLSHCTQVSDIGFGALGRMSELSCLELRGCRHLSDMAAAELRHLTRMTDLDLAECPLLTNGAVAALTSMAALRCLSLARCPQLTDAGVAPLLSTLRRLDHLDASGLHRIQGASLAELPITTTTTADNDDGDGGCALTELLLEDCVALRDLHLPSLAVSTRLTHLSLAGAVEVTDGGISPALASLPSLTTLDLSSCALLTGSCLLSTPTTLTSTLTSLLLSSCTALSDGGLLAALTLHRLTHLDLAGCWRLSDAALGRLSPSLLNLRTLSLRGCIWLREAGTSAVSSLPRLTRLDLSGCRGLTDAHLSPIHRLSPTLAHLSLNGCPRLEGELALAPLARLCHLRSLELDKAAGLCAAAAAHLARLPSLTSLSLSCCAKLDDAGLVAAVGDGAALASLSVANCGALSEASLMELARRDALRRLTRLDMSNCREMGDGALAVLCAGAPRLVSLNVAQCCAVTDAGIACVAAELIMLEELSAAFCFELTDGCLPSLAGLPLLRTLDIAGCFNVTHLACDALRDVRRLAIVRQWSEDEVAADQARRCLSDGTTLAFSIL